MKGTLAALAIPTLCLSLALSLPGHGRAACSYFAAKDRDIHQPGQKAFITWDPAAKAESFTVQPRFEGNALDFGMVVPTPSRPKLDEMPRDFFKDLAIYTILMPLPQPIWAELDPLPRAPASGAAGAVADGGLVRSERKQAVRVLESGVVGSLDYKIIVAEETRGLYDWLKENGYSFAGDEATLDFYVQKRWFFTVMKIDPAQMKKAPDGSYTGEVTPTRFSFRSEACIYPLKITQISVKDQTEALFYVQSPEQMDLDGDWSWQHSFRVMYLTFVLGKAIAPREQEELAQRNAWILEKKQREPRFDTTKLEWAKKLGEAEIGVLDDPLKRFPQMGIEVLAPGDQVIPLARFLKEVEAEYLKSHPALSDHARRRLAQMEDQYQPSKGLIVKSEKPTRGSGASYTWYPNREAPPEEVKGLARLKGHLQRGQWLTKFRKVLRKVEMTRDLTLVALPREREQSYVRILPTSPP